jgi:hypothetical protein
VTGSTTAGEGERARPQDPPLLRSRPPEPAPAKLLPSPPPSAAADRASPPDPEVRNRSPLGSCFTGSCRGGSGPLLMVSGTMKGMMMSAGLSTV